MNKLDPTILVIFGITGDLSRRYLLPALYHLCKDGLLPEPMVIIGTSRQALEIDDFLSHVELCVLEADKVCDPAVLQRLKSQLRLLQFDPADPTAYRRLSEEFAAIEAAQHTCFNRLYYLSLPPQLYETVVGHLGRQGLNGSCQHGAALTRLVVEKPFGHDLATAETLIGRTADWFGEDQVFRIDHYLAKETVQNVLLFRQRNPAYEQRWRGGEITSIDITAYEAIDVQGRKFYDQIGALRDLIQSHLLQLLALLCMELPAQLTSEAIHAGKQAFLDSLGPFPADKVTTQSYRGQYDGYRQQVDSPQSATETFAALWLDGPTERWRGTRLRLATGKALDNKRTALTVTFRDGSQVCFRVQPEPQIEATGGPPADTDFSDIAQPINHHGADAYERVLIDAIRGDQTLFASGQEVMACWRIVQPVLDAWDSGQPPLHSYLPGSAPDSLVP